MAYNTVPIKKDVDGKPIPQYYNPLANAYEELQGSGGASNAKVTESVLPEGAATEVKQNSTITELQAIKETVSTSAKQDTMITGIGAPADVEATGNGSIIAILKRIRTLFTAIKDTDGIKKIVDPIKLAGNDTMLQGNLTLTGAVQQLNANTACKIVTIQAEPTNTGYTYVGKNDVSANAHMFTLSPGSSITITTSNLNLLYVSGKAGDKVCWGGEA